MILKYIWFFHYLEAFQFHSMPFINSRHYFLNCWSPFQKVLACAFILPCFPYAFLWQCWSFMPCFLIFDLFCTGWVVGIYVHFSTCGHPLFTAPSVQGIVFSSVYAFSIIVKSGDCICVGLFLSPLVYSIALCICFCSNIMLLLLLLLQRAMWNPVLCYLQHCVLYICLGLLWLLEVFCVSIWMIS